MSRYRRWNDLLELLATAGQLQVEEAAAALNVSAATVRRDFDELAAQQMLTRIRGGAVAQGVNYDLPLRYKSERHPSEKQRIGALAASMVLAGQAVGLNGVEDGRYSYWVAMLDCGDGDAPVYRVTIADDFASWAVTGVQ